MVKKGDDMFKCEDTRSLIQVLIFVFYIVVLIFILTSAHGDGKFVGA